MLLKIPQTNDKLVIMQDEFPRHPLKDRQQLAMKCMLEGMQKLFSTGVHFWIGCGSFLGLYRDGKFIDHDLDIDISARLDRNNYIDGEKRIRDAMKDWKLIRTIHYDSRVFQLAYIDPNETIFDITFYYTGIINGKLVSYSDQGTVIEDADLFNNFIPYPAETYLEQRYGDWRTPTGIQTPRNYVTKSLNPDIGLGLI